jgi:hypothetical protein
LLLAVATLHSDPLASVIEAYRDYSRTILCHPFSEWVTVPTSHRRLLQGSLSDLL